MSGWDIVITLGAAIAGGIIGWFANGWSQRTKVQGTGNTVASAGGDLTQVGGDQVGGDQDKIGAPSEPYVNVEIHGGFLMVVNTSRDRPARHVTWRLNVSGTAAVPYFDVVDPPGAGLALAPGGTHRIARWAPAFGYKSVTVLVRWTGDDGQIREHTSTLS